ncbi:MAG TPA: hypothetical protein VG815_10690, partial [Chloroflexota bacterium]|nr:hypothetical protein [Chloroflexota bacterium]
MTVSPRERLRALPLPTSEKLNDEATRIYRTTDIKMVWVSPGAAAIEEYNGRVPFERAPPRPRDAAAQIDGGHIGQNVLGKATHATAGAHIFCHRMAARNGERGRVVHLHGTWNCIWISWPAQKQ